MLFGPAPSRRLHWSLTDAQKARFFEEGYVVIPDLFWPSEFDPLISEIDNVLDSVARRLRDEGRISDLRQREGFETRLTRLLEDCPDCASEYFRAIEGKGGGGHAGRAMFDLITHPRLLDAMESLVGPEIIGSSVYRIRPKVPGRERGVVPWHQDSGYFARHCDESLIVTCWIPLVDATPENGCLQVLPRVHGRGIARHRTNGPAGFLIIEDPDLPAPPVEAVTVPVPLGGALLMTNMTPHCSTPNTSDVVRWSVDLRYQSADVPSNVDQEPEEYDPDAPLTNIACYPPEGDFIVRSRRNPSSVHTYEQFLARRSAYEAARVPFPGRGWQPVGA